MSRIWWLFGLGTAAVCFADTLTLRNGDVVEGNYLGGTARIIRMEVNGQIQTFDIGMVNGLRFNTSSGSSGGPSGAPPDAPPPPPVASSSDRSRERSGDRPVLRRAPSQDAPQENVSAQSGPPPNYQPSSYQPPPVPPTPASIEIPAGTQFTVRMIDSVDSEVARLGDTFRASIDEPVSVGGQTVISRGADVVAKLVEDTQSGKIAGKTVLKLALVSVKINDRMVDVTTQDVTKESSSRGARSGKVIGGTAALGAIIGGIAGGGKGAAIGAGSGAAVGTGAEEVTKNQRVKIPSETRLVFTLSYAVHV